MLRLRHRQQILVAVLLLVSLIYGCGGGDAGYEGYEEAVVSGELGGRLEPGVPASVRLWGEHSSHFYEGKEGEVITLSVASDIPGLDPNVRLFGPDDREEAFDDDSGGNGFALIEDYLLRREGTYEVRIETDEDQPGEVSVLLSRKGDVEGILGTPMGLAEPAVTAEPIVTDLLTDR